MDAVFVELPPFTRYRPDYLDDAGYRSLQALLMRDPQAGDLIMGTGGLRKLRFIDGHRRKGKRGGLRIIYYWWLPGAQFWLFTVYGKDVQDDLDPSQKRLLGQLLATERRKRTTE